MGRLIVLGSVNMDLIAAVPHLPAPGETVLGSSLVQLPGGKGANQAVAAARLGAQVTLVGRVGNDPYGFALMEHLAREPIGELAIERDRDRPSGVAIVLVGQDGQNMITVLPGCNSAVGKREVARAVNALTEHSLLLVQLEIPADTVCCAIERAHAVGARIVLNASPATTVEADLLSGVHVCVLNETEASAVVGWPVANVEKAGEAVRELHGRGVGLAIVTLGAEGAVFSEDGQVHHVEAPSVPVVDTTGAGDAFAGALCAALLAGCEPAEAVFLATSPRKTRWRLNPDEVLASIPGWPNVLKHK
jgi:ribokinase